MSAADSRPDPRPESVEIEVSDETAAASPDRSVVGLHPCCRSGGGYP